MLAIIFILIEKYIKMSVSMMKLLKTYIIIEPLASFKRLYTSLNDIYDFNVIGWSNNIHG